MKLFGNKKQTDVAEDELFIKDEQASMLEKLNSAENVTKQKSGILEDMEKLNGGGEEPDEIDDEKIQAEQIKAIVENSFLQKYLTDTVTDISFNGTQLWVQDNKHGRYMPEEQPEEHEVAKLAYIIAARKGLEFTDSDPIMDVEINGLRINAVHRIVSPFGTTMAVRISRPRLAIQDIKEVSNQDVADLLKACMIADESVVISGITGSGKTELQKAMVKHIPLSKKITLIEDSMDSHLKTLFPEKDINSWRSLTSSSRTNLITFEVLIKAALRNNPDWLLISEIRGADAYDFNNALLTGHSGISTIHASGASNIPSRMRNMIAQQYDISPLLLGQDIVENLHFGVHMEMVQDPELGIYRRIREVVEFVGYGEEGVQSTFLYRVHKKYDEETGKYIPLEQINPISARTASIFQRKELYHLIPKIFRPDLSKKR